MVLMFIFLNACFKRLLVCYLQRLEEKYRLSFAVNVFPKTFKCYVYDNHARFENKQKFLQYLEILNRTDSYDFKIFRKPAITNVKIKFNSNMAANVSAKAFKMFLSRAYKICSERFIDEKFSF